MKVLPLSITEADKSVIVTVHNNFRRQVAKGLEYRGSPGPQPAAANMREIVTSSFKHFIITENVYFIFTSELG